MEAQNSSAETDEEWLAQNMDWIKKNAPDWLPPSKQKSDECYPDLNGLTFDSNFEANIASTPQLNRNIPQEEYNLPDQYVITFPTVAHIEPIENKYPTIKIQIFNVCSYVLNASSVSDKKSVFLLYARILTTPMEVEAQYRKVYHSWKLKKLQKLPTCKILDIVFKFHSAEEWHGKFWASLRWFAKLTGVPDLDDVRIKIYNNLSKAFGGFQYYPFDLKKIVWVKPVTTEIDKLETPEAHGIVWVNRLGGNNTQGGTIADWISIPKIMPNINPPSLWILRAGAEKLDPSYRDGTGYARWKSSELMPAPVTAPSTIKITAPNLSSDFVQTLLDHFGEQLKPRINKMMMDSHEEVMKKKRRKKRSDSDSELLTDLSPNTPRQSYASPFTPKD